MGVQMFVCLLVCGGLMEIQTPALIDLDEIFHAHPHLSKEGFGAGLTPDPSTLGLGAWNPKSWSIHFQDAQRWDTLISAEKFFTLCYRSTHLGCTYGHNIWIRDGFGPKICQLRRSGQVIFGCTFSKWLCGSGKFFYFFPGETNKSIRVGSKNIRGRAGLAPSLLRVKSMLGIGLNKLIKNHVVMK